jgi:amino-acid N-acetyltransferase
MHLFRQPPEPQVRRLLSDAKLPTADLTPEHLKHFIGCGLEQVPKGVVGLEIYGPDALLRSLTVEDKTRGKGCGKALVAEAERYAKEQGVRRIYLLTTNAAKFFGNLGYSVVVRDDAPECIRRTPEFSSLCPSSSTFMAKDLAAIRR